jgi:hypothetical protein
MLTIEHIDPRNGVLISGLENEFNEIFADYSYNSKKVNRFVPYRVKDYPAPVNEGDIGEFLIEGEWKVCEFMVPGGLWWRESNKIGNNQVSGGRSGGKTGGRISGPKNRDLGRGIFSRSEEKIKEDSKKAANCSAEKTSKAVMCIETGVVFKSAREASRLTKVSSSNVIRCANGKRKTAGGFTWAYV